MRFVIDHPLFRHPTLAPAWKWCASSNRERQFSALLALASNRLNMPGAIFFTVSERSLTDEQWSSIIEASEPLCRCKTRRIMYPLQGRSRLATAWPEPIVESLHADTAYSTGRGNFFDSPSLVLAPHGGGLDASFASFTIKDDWLYVQQRPFMTDKRVNVVELWTPVDGIAERSRPVWRARFEDLQCAIELRGEVPFYQRMPDPKGRLGQSGALPLCSLVMFVTGVGSEPVELVFEIDGSLQVFTDVSEKEPEHYCPNA